ncbi:oryzin precursor [Hypoxylon sp. FL0543]|nr:oryzin precursor [Hypoxylon sp. FL0543]
MVNLRKLALLSTAVVGLVSTRPPPYETGNSSGNSSRYIVTLKEGLEPFAVEQHIQRATGLRTCGISPTVEVGRRWNIGSWNAYSCTMDRNTITQLQDDEAVDVVEDDTAVTLTKHFRQERASWGLGTISHREIDHTDYVYDSRAGEGTYAYILDTGLLFTHQEFEGRAYPGYNAVEGEFVDDIGHGTHVAGTIAGKTYGVARKAKLISVKIFAGGRSSISDLLEGFHWAVRNITSANRQEVSVINISAAGWAIEAVNRAVEEAYRLGILTVVAAGNSDSDVQHFSPASAPNAITVGAIGRDYSRSNFSNWGALVDIFAPGEAIPSAWITNDHDVRSLSGTSMATPHISGLLLYLKSIIPYRMKTPVDSVQELGELATEGVISNARGSKNLLGFNGNGVVISAGS